MWGEEPEFTSGDKGGGSAPLKQKTKAPRRHAVGLSTLSLRMTSRSGCGSPKRTRTQGSLFAVGRSIFIEPPRLPSRGFNPHLLDETECHLRQLVRLTQDGYTRLSQNLVARQSGRLCGHIYISDA